MAVNLNGPGAYRNINYSFNQPLNQAFPTPIIANRAPTGADVGYPLVTFWNWKVNNELYVLTSVIGGVANWNLLDTSGGAIAGTSLFITTGPNSIAGTTTINGLGSASTTNIGTGGTGIVNIGNTAGNTAVTGDLIASSFIAAPTLYATGDLGGAAATIGITDVSVPIAGGTGAFTITSATTAAPAVNAGFIKMYIGTTTVFVPYYLTTA